MRNDRQRLAPIVRWGLLSAAAVGLTIFVAAPIEAAKQPLLIASPEAPGADLPPAGRSLFDKLFEQGAPAADRADARYAIPYPFEEIVAQVNARIAPERAKAVLIPLGRSLQRFAADPDFFQSPRVVVAVDRQGRDCKDDCPLLKDRLFIGYQERSGVIEVISYNEDAGRFEFQIVEDYGAGGTPRVRYAARSICTTCHQAHAPIFAIALWSETNGNARVGDELAKYAASFHGVAAKQGVDVPDAIDLATDRASRFAFANFVWRKGCGGLAAAEAASCRGVLLEAALRYLLGGARGLWPDGNSGQAALARVLHERLESIAPDGIAVPSPDFPDRDPLLSVEAGANPLDVIEPDGVFDPTQPRLPLVFWEPSDGHTAFFATLVRDIATFFLPQDIAKLSDDLVARGDADAARRDYRAACTTRRIALNGELSELRLACAGGGDDSLQLEGHVVLEADRVIGGQVRALTFSGLPPVQRLTIAGGERQEGDGGEVLVLELRETALGLAPRLTSGERLSNLTLQGTDGEWTEAAISVIDDTAALDAVIERLAGRADDDEAVLGGDPIRRDAIMAAIANGLAAR